MHIGKQFGLLADVFLALEFVDKLKAGCWKDTDSPTEAVQLG